MKIAALAVTMVWVGLHAATLAQTSPRTSPIPHSKVRQYTYRTDSITFYNLANVQTGEKAYNITLQNKTLLGDDLPEGTALRDVFFVYNGSDGFKAETIAQTVQTSDRSRIQPAYPFSRFMANKEQPYFAGNPTYGFAIAAIGGLLFTDSLPNAADAAVPVNAPLVSCQDAALLRHPAAKNFVRYFPIRNNDQNDIIQPKKGQATPVILSYGLTDRGEGVILTQFEYLVSDSTWRIQILYYTVSGKTEFIIGHFGINAAAETPTADKSFFIVPTVAKSGDTLRDFIAFGKGIDKVDIGIGHLPCWSVLTTIDSVNKKGIPANGPHHAKIGRRISVVPPVDSAAFTLEGLKAYPNRLEGWGVLDPRKSSMASYENIRSILILSSDQTPEQNAAHPPVFINKNSRYKPGDKVSTNNNKDVYTVLFDTMPSHFDKLDSVPLAKGRLKQNTNYYLYVYMGDTNAYTITSYFYHPKPTAVFGPHKTLSVGAVTNFEVSEIIKDSVVLNLETESNDAYSVVVGSLNVNPLNYNDMVGIYNNRDVAVSAFLKPGVKRTSLYLPKGEGGYLHCYAAKIIDRDTFYTDNPLTKTVYRPTDTLPLLFNFRTIDVAKTDPPAGVQPLLPPGWYHGTYSNTANPADQAYFSAKIDVSNTPHLHITAPKENYRASLLAPVFISDYNKVRTTFVVEYHQNGLAYTPVKGKDSIFVEYRLNSGAWQTALAMGDIPSPSGEGRRLINANFECAQGDTVRMRYGVRLGQANVSHSLMSLNIERDHSCKAPINLTTVSDHNTDKVVEVSWTDPNPTPAVTYAVDYQLANTAFPNEWNRTYTKRKSVVLNYLTSYTDYRVRVLAVCAVDTSVYSDFVVAKTQYGLPFSDSLKVVYATTGNPNSAIVATPLDRGFASRVGIIGDVMDLSQNPDLTWSVSNTFTAFNKQCLRGFGVGEHVANGAFMSPVIYSETDVLLNFTISSFKLDSVVGDTKYMSYGASPTDKRCKLHVAVNNDGHFRENDILYTFTGDQLNLVDSTFVIEVQKSGRIQVGFFFENPTMQKTDKFYIEVSHIGLSSNNANRYELSLDHTPANGGTVSGAGTYRHGQEVSISALAADGYYFVAWKEGETEVSKSQNYSFVMPGRPVHYTAVFQQRVNPEYELKLTPSPSEGGIVMGKGYFKAGTTTVIAARPNQGYSFVAWVDADNNNDTISKHNSHSLVMPAHDVNYLALFHYNYHNEDAQLRAGFSLSAENGMLHVRNQCGVRIKNVDVYGLNGAHLHRFAPGSCEDLNLPIDAANALVFVRLHTEKGVVVYKVYVR